MAKPPGTKHSKPRKEPVTIDLDPKDVQRKADTSAAAASSAGAAAQPTAAPKPAPGTPETHKPSAASAGSSAASQAKPDEAAPGPTAAKAEAPKPEQKPEPAKPAQADAAKSSDKEPEKPAKAEVPPKAGSAAGSVPPRSTPPGGAGGPGGGSTPPPGPRPAATAPAGRGSNALLAGVAGGLIALALVAGLQWAGVWPGGASPRDSAEVAELRLEVQELRQSLAATATGPEAGDLDARITEAVEASAVALSQRIEALEQAAVAPDGEAVELGPLQAQLDELEAAIAALGDGTSPEGAVQEVDGRLADLSQRLDALEAAAPDTATGAAEEQLADMSARVEALEAAGGEADDLAARLAAIEEQLAGVVSELGERADEPRAALVLAASSLRAAIERGGSFEAELEIYAALAPEAEGVAELGAHAANGVDTNAELIADLPGAVDRMLIAGRERREADGVLDGLWQSARDLVTVRPVGVVEGDGVDAVIARLEAAVRAGDHGRALDEYDALPSAAQAAGADFMDRVRARHQVDTLVDQALSQALRAS
jgi:hypothetical protein